MTRAERKAAAHERVRRAAEQLVQLHEATRNATANPTSPLGEPIHNRVVRVTRAGDGARAGKGRWSHVTTRDNHMPVELLRQLGTRGIAPGSKKLDTMLVTRADGTSVVAPANLRKPRARRAPVQVAEITHTIMCADLAPIGNVE